ARMLMDRLPASDATTLDALFAGMPRRAFWPAGPVDRSDIDELRRETDARAGAGRRGCRRRATAGCTACATYATHADARAAAAVAAAEARTEMSQESAAASAPSGQAGPPLDAPPTDRRGIPGP